MRFSEILRTSALPLLRASFIFHCEKKKKERRKAINTETKKIKHLLSSGVGVGSGFGVWPGKQTKKLI